MDTINWNIRGPMMGSPPSFERDHARLVVKNAPSNDVWTIRFIDDFTSSFGIITIKLLKNATVVYTLVTDALTDGFTHDEPTYRLWITFVTQVHVIRRMHLSGSVNTYLGNQYHNIGKINCKSVASYNEGNGLDTEGLSFAFMMDSATCFWRCTMNRNIGTRVLNTVSANTQNGATDSGTEKHMTWNLGFGHIYKVAICFAEMHIDANDPIEIEWPLVSPLSPGRSRVIAISNRFTLTLSIAVGTGFDWRLTATSSTQVIALDFNEAQRPTYWIFRLQQYSFKVRLSA